MISQKLGIFFLTLVNSAYTSLYSSLLCSKFNASRKLSASRQYRLNPTDYLIIYPREGRLHE